MDTPHTIKTVDYHTASEPLRIVTFSTLPSRYSTSLPSHPPLHTAAQTRLAILAAPDHPLNTLRKALCLEPRGHDGMYGAYIIDADTHDSSGRKLPEDERADFGAIWWHGRGFSTACGHGSMALGVWAVETGLVDLPDLSGSDGKNGVVDVKIDVPSGRVAARVFVRDGRVEGVEFASVRAFAVAMDMGVIEEHGRTITLDLGYAGALYAFVRVGDVGLKVEKKVCTQLIREAKKIKTLLGSRGRWAGEDLYGVCFYDEETSDHDEGQEVLREKNVVIFADGQVDRSPCGSGTAARVAVLVANGSMKTESKLINTSIVDTVFEAEIDGIETETETGYPSCAPRIRGNAYRTGSHEFYVDPKDPTFPGFLLE